VLELESVDVELVVLGLRVLEEDGYFVLLRCDDFVFEQLLDCREYFLQCALALKTPPHLLTEIDCDDDCFLL